MKSLNLLISMSIIITSIIVISCKTQEPVENKKIELTSAKDSASYALGMQIGNNLSQQGLNERLDVDIILAGIKDMTQNETLIEMDKTDALLQAFFEEMQKEESGDKITEGEKFLAENAKRDEVVTLPSGLQYEILVEGNGPKPDATSTVKTHYKGTLLDGRVFDSSYDRGEPTSFPVNRVIAGWTEALQLMPVGSKWKLYIPYNLAYGERGAGQLIGPFETLIFEIELLDIED
jgi:FKBP-type peptidyl-prolyl cis-trans isomerase FklB